MGLLDAIVGRFVVKIALVASIVPIVLLGQAADTLADMGFPRDVVGPIAAFLMVVWAVGLLGLIAMQIDWD